MQITVFCNGDVTYDSAVTVTDPNPTAYDAIMVSNLEDSAKEKIVVAGGMVFTIGSGKVYAFGRGGDAP
jgi:hypothetical protein